MQKSLFLTKNVNVSIALFFSLGVSALMLIGWKHILLCSCLILPSALFCAHSPHFLMPFLGYSFVGINGIHKHPYHLILACNAPLTNHILGCIPRTCLCPMPELRCHACSWWCASWLRLQRWHSCELSLVSALSMLLDCFWLFVCLMWHFQHCWCAQPIDHGCRSMPQVAWWVLLIF